MVEIYKGILQSIFQAFSYSWWIVLPIFLFSIFWKVWIIYIRTRTISKIKWKLFEIKVTTEVLKTPKSMEQVIAGLYASYSYGLNWLKKYVDGEVEKRFSLEMVGTSSGVYFYIYAPADSQNLVESAVYGQYPEAEINEVEDYADFVSSVLPNEVYDVFGMELGLARDSFYPIKRYYYFEAMVEEQRIDPIAAISEVMSKLKEDEKIWIQILISPTGSATGNDWKKEGEKKIDEIIGRKKDKKSGGFFSDINVFINNFLWAPVEPPIWPGEKKPDAPTNRTLSPDEQDLVKEIYNKISYLGFEFLIRFVYIDRQDSFSPANVSAIMGALHQFNTQNLNAFKPNTMTITNYDSLLARIFPSYKKMIVLYKKRRLFNYYKQRRFGQFNKIREEKFSVLNTEELATIFHFPTVIVKAPSLKRVEAKKGSPPSGLPTE
ncbi:MAG: hypothetical protein AAB596_00540 [Patescibacteria group bacterium]